VLSFAVGDGAVPEHAIFGNHRPGDAFVMETTAGGQLREKPLPESLAHMMDQPFFYDTRPVSQIVTPSLAEFVAKAAINKGALFYPCKPDHYSGAAPPLPQ
jgi:hypothetical protein